MRQDWSIDDKMKMIQFISKNTASVYELNQDEPKRENPIEWKSLINDDWEFDADFET